VIQRETRKRVGVGTGVIDWRHAYLAIQREHTLYHSIRGAWDYIYDNRPSQIRRLEDIIAKQSGHGRYIKDMIDGVAHRDSRRGICSERSVSIGIDF